LRVLPEREITDIMLAVLHSPVLPGTGGRTDSGETRWPRDGNIQEILHS
jgi:hypothetical protein